MSSGKVRPAAAIRRSARARAEVAQRWSDLSEALVAAVDAVLDSAEVPLDSAAFAEVVDDVGLRDSLIDAIGDLIEAAARGGGK